MESDYFEPDIGLHPFAVMSPTHDGAAFLLLTQGSHHDVAHQLTAYREAFRVLLRKQVLVRPSDASASDPSDSDPSASDPSARQAALSLVPFRVGVHLVITPAREPDVERFMRRVQIVGLADASDAAARLAESVRNTALVCEVIGLVDGIGAIDTMAWPIAR
jgi:hypothetical protein